MSLKRQTANAIPIQFAKFNRRHTGYFSQRPLNGYDPELSWTHNTDWREVYRLRDRCSTSPRLRSGIWKGSGRARMGARAQRGDPWRP